MEQPLFRRRLAEQMKRCAETSGGFLALEEDIQHVLGVDEPPIKRRQLTKLANGEDLPLRSSQLESLDQYLQVRCHTSIGRLYATPSVLQEIAAHGTVGFVLGSQPDKEARRIDLSRWDIRSMRDLLNQLYRLGQPLQIQFEDVIYRGHEAEMFRSTAVPKNEVWFHDLESEHGPSVLCLGSPKANHCAEVMLADMLGVEPFRPWSAKAPRPFGFVWANGDMRAEEIESCVKLDVTRDELELRTLKGFSHDLLQRLKQWKPTPEHRTPTTLAIVFDGKIVEVCRDGESWDSYAIVAARRLGKRMHVCIAGLTGPATLGAARLLHRFEPKLELELDSPLAKPAMAWTVVKVHVSFKETEDYHYRFDGRRVEKEPVFEDEVRYFLPE
jgi:hypothetical protein